MRYQKQRLVDVLNQVKELKMIDPEMTSDIEGLLKDANAIWEDGKHVMEMQKEMNPFEFFRHQAMCKQCFKVMMMTGGLKEYTDYQQWSHNNKEVQCEKIGHTKWLVENINVLN
tara:strand:- start:3089 stop:3430 length:342 start_codon:yes stop_codon:yes gene_type:complete